MKFERQIDESKVRKVLRDVLRKHLVGGICDIDDTNVIIKIIEKELGIDEE